MKYFSGFLMLVAGVLLVLLGYSNWLRIKFKNIGIPTEDIHNSSFIGFAFILSGFGYLLYKLLKKEDK